MEYLIPRYPGRAILAPGRKNVAVKQLQVRLKGSGHYDGIVDGLLGPKTLEAVRSYQLRQPRLWRHYGRVSRRTWETLFQT